MPNPTLVEAEIWTVARTEQGNAVLVRPIGSEIAVPIFIGTLETQSILIGFGGVDIPRPLTHDLLLTVLRAFSLTVNHIEITDLRNETYFSRVFVSGPSGSRDFDARPSDALALAIRVKCPIFVAEHVVDEAGINVNLVVEGLTTTSMPEDEKPGRNRKDDEIAELTSRLEAAISEENYELAAEIRDKIQRLKTEE